MLHTNSRNMVSICHPASKLHCKSSELLTPGCFVALTAQRSSREGHSSQRTPHDVRADKFLEALGPPWWPRWRKTKEQKKMKHVTRGERCNNMGVNVVRQKDVQTVGETRAVQKCPTGRHTPVVQMSAQSGPPWDAVKTPWELQASTYSSWHTHTGCCVLSYHKWRVWKVVLSGVSFHIYIGHSLLREMESSPQTVALCSSAERDGLQWQWQRVIVKWPHSFSLMPSWRRNENCPESCQREHVRESDGGDKTDIKKPKTKAREQSGLSSPRGREAKGERQVKMFSKQERAVWLIETESTDRKSLSCHWAERQSLFILLTSARSCMSSEPCIMCHHLPTSYTHLTNTWV